MKVPLLDLNAQLITIEQDLKNAVNRVIDSTQYILSNEVQQFEEAIASYIGVRFGIGVSSGTDALLVSLMCLDVTQDDLVITTPYSFFATAGAISRLGATPVFVDIDLDTYNISIDALSDWFHNNQDKVAHVKAIIPVHLFGQCANMEGVEKVASKYEIPIIEDAAQAIGAKYLYEGKEKFAGSMGLCGCFSFFPSKNLGCIGDGGMVVTNNEAFAQKLQIFRNHGAMPKYYHKYIGGNFRLDSIQAAVLLAKLPYLDSWHKMRQDNASYYDENLNGSCITTPSLVYPRKYHIYNQYIISVSKMRDELRAYLTDNDIGSEVYYPVPFHEQECFKHLGYKNGEFPNSEYAAKHTLALPVYPELTREMQDYVIEKILHFYDDYLR
jgi:dTDP-4-amino-4,6-dideoxygalactose transaminase